MLDMQFLCNERKGLALRRVVEVPASPMLEVYLRQHLPPEPLSPMKDVTHIYSKGARTFLVDDVGMLYAGVIELDGMPDVHMAFWDKALRGREVMCYTMAQVVAHEAGAPGVWTAIPPEARTALAFARRIGFIERAKSDAGIALVLIT